jgi:hypothetical protein
MGEYGNLFKDKCVVLLFPQKIAYLKNGELMYGIS